MWLVGPSETWAELFLKVQIYHLLQQATLQYQPASAPPCWGREGTESPEVGGTSGPPSAPVPTMAAVPGEIGVAPLTRWATLAWHQSPMCKKGALGFSIPKGLSSKAVLEFKVSFGPGSV